MRPRSSRDDSLGASVVIWTTTPWTIPGNRAISFSPKIAYGLYRGHRRAGGQLGEARRPVHSRRQARRRRLAAGARHRPIKRLQRGRGRGLWRRSSALIRCTAFVAATTSPCRCSPAITSPTTPAPASCTPRPATAARTSTSGPRTRASSRRAASTPPSPTPSTPTAASPSRRRASPASASSPTRARRATPTRR